MHTQFWVTGMNVKKSLDVDICVCEDVEMDLRDGVLNICISEVDQDRAQQLAPFITVMNC
jgi:hypothetical protein